MSTTRPINKTQKVSESSLEKEIEDDKKIRDHVRSENIKDFGYIAAKLVIVGTFLLLFIWAIVLGIHYIATDNWVALEENGKAILSYAFAYIVGFFSQIGLLPKKD